MRFGKFLFPLLLWASAAGAQALLPNGQQQFVDGNGQPVAGGSVYFYVPGTTSAKLTYQNPQLTTPNTNPVVLNSAGRAVVWGSGLYREVVYDSAGNLIWDQLTSGAGSLPVARQITVSQNIAACSSLFPVVASAPVTLNMPSAPNQGDTCTIADAGNTAATDNITVNFGAKVLNNGASTDVLNTNGAVRTYTWLGTPAVWQLQDESPPSTSVTGYYAVDSGAVNALAVTLSPAPVNQAALVGVPIRIKVGTTNTVNVPTLNVNALGAHNIVSIGVDESTAAASVIGAGTLAVNRIITVVWDGSVYQLQNQLKGASAQIIGVGADTVLPITSAALAAAVPGSNYLLNPTSFYQYLVNNGTDSGLGSQPLIQSGVYNPATGNQDVFNFPTTFPTRGVSIVANVLNGASNVDLVTISFANNAQGVVSVWEWNGTTFVNVAGHSIHWVATGF